MNLRINYFFLFLLPNSHHLLQLLKGPAFLHHWFLIWMVEWYLKCIFPILCLWGQKISCLLKSKVEFKFAEISTNFISFLETSLFFSLLGGQPLLNMPKFFFVFFFHCELLDQCVILISVLDFYLIGSKRRQLLNINSKLLLVSSFSKFWFDK